MACTINQTAETDLQRAVLVATKNLNDAAVVVGRAGNPVPIIPAKKENPHRLYRRAGSVWS